MASKVSDSLVDEWLRGSEGSLPFADDSAATSSVSINQSSSSLGRVGLGFENQKVKPDSNRVKDNALLHRLEKSEKKRKREAEATPSVSTLHHGVIDNMDDEEFESRTKVVSALSSGGKDSKPNAKKAKGEKKAAAASPDSSSAIAPTSQPSTAPASVAKSTESGQRQDHSQHSSSGEEPRKNKHKRIKTRSKQKNIRRDNRPDSQKPSHLIVGSKEFKGRPVTHATIQALGRPSKPSE